VRQVRGAPALGQCDARRLILTGAEAGPRPRSNCPTSTLRLRRTPPPPRKLVKLTRREYFGEGAARAAEIDYGLDPNEVVAAYTTTSPEEPEPKKRK
jgi:hypothetical protein